MSALILTGMAACFILLVAAVLAHRVVTQEPRQKDHGPDCRHCAELRHPSRRPARPHLTAVPRQRSNR